MTKDFSWEGSPVSLWRIERVEEEGFDGNKLPLVICEGEMDALTLNDCGVMNATSVPNGAPNKINLYVGREPVRFNIPEEEAVESLVHLIKEHDKWVEPQSAVA